MNTTFRGCIFSLSLGAALAVGTWLIVRPVCRTLEAQTLAVAFLAPPYGEAR